jgi:hypothetical protein
LQIPSKLRHGQGVDAIVLGMRADEFPEGYLPTKIERDHETIVSAGNLEPLRAPG